jgi:hypothetical protein
MSKPVFVCAWVLLALVKLALAWTLPLFGDEAFYWWESQRPAWSYSDLPPLTAWMVSLGAALVPGELGVRLPFWLLGLALPWQLVAIARRDYDEATAWRAGTLALLLPLAALLGVLALPDVALVVVSVWTVDAVARALAGERRGPWLEAGLAAAIGLLCHYRFAALLLVLAVVALGHRRGRSSLRRAGPWLAVAIAALGLLPLVWFNLANELASVRFQLLDRHPWAWQGSGWLQLPEQALVTSPLLLGLLGWAGWRALARRPAVWPESLFVASAVALWLLFFALGFFADNERFRWHWPLTACVLLLPALAARLPLLPRPLRIASWSAAGLVLVVVVGYLAAALLPGRAADWLDGKRFPANFSGWREAAAWVDGTAGSGGNRLVVDNFMLGATLDFYRDPADTRPIVVLDDALNGQHGRAAQLMLWGIDETALAAAPAQPGWLVVEETARRFSDRWAWYHGLCARFSGLVLDQALTLHGGRKRFVRWRFDAYSPRPSCTRPAALPPLGWVELPSRVAAGAPIPVFGWVVQPGLGIEAVELHVDGGAPVPLRRDVEIDWVEQRWGEVGDPAGRRLGFRTELDSAGLAAGARRISIRVRRSDGLDWLLHEQVVVVGR